ncbi:AfsR/SARP family transcriptional regulator [Micromonospora sp. NBC_01638]|uniref:AfsR/SARP family transcriptional regulator n=1 Tax=Micromonospora sp. NBC_01638 TaxID=2975982 RepID=UPI00386709B1|nr:tetratricopeptide repeat protein [Micromonospora sp. NBC_01638]
MEIKVLGGLEVRLADVKLHPGTPKQQTVLAMLAVHANRIVSVEQLIDELWPAAPPRSAVPNVRGYAANLRRMFESAVAGKAVLNRQRNGYRLQLDPDRIDLIHFENQYREARNLAAQGSPGSAEERLRLAVDQWKGPMLVGVPLGPILTARCTAAEEERRLAIELLAETRTRIGRPELAIPLLRQLLALHPLRESAHQMLMRALHLYGDAAGAVAAYESAREALRGQLGIEPGPELQQFWRSITGLSDDGGAPRIPVHPAPGTAAGRGAADAQVERSLPTVAAWLPRTVEQLIGRKELVSQLLSETEPGAGTSSAVHVIDGMAGIGKTTLAVHLARRLADRYPDAQLFIDLRGHGQEPVDQAAALATLLRQLGVPGTRMPAGSEDRVSLWRQELGRRRVVIVLDNVANSAQIAPLLPVGPGAVVLVTSRRRLAIPSAQLPVTLAALAPEEATELLATVVGRQRLETDLEAARFIAERCGYLPLALRLVGTRLAHRPQWQIGDLARRLEEPVALLSQLRAEDRTVVEAFAASYEPLAEGTKRLFRMVGLHPGDHLNPAMIAAAGRVSLDVASGIIDELVDKHLVEEVDDGLFRLHDLMRHYALGLAMETDSAADRRDALEELLDHTLHAAVLAAERLEKSGALRADLRLSRPRRTDLLGEPSLFDARWLETQRPNIEALVRNARLEGLGTFAWQLARVTWRFCYIRGYFDDIIRNHQEGLAAAEAGSELRAAAEMHNYIASAHLRQAAYGQALSHLEKTISIRRKLGDNNGVARARVNIGSVFWLTGRLHEALTINQEMTRSRYDLSGLLLLPNTGLTLSALGRYDEALKVHRLHLLHARLASDYFHICNALSHLGGVRTRMRDSEQAVRLLAASMALRDRTGHRYGEAETLNDLATAHRQLGRLDEALRLHHASMDAARLSGERHVEAAALNELGRTLLTKGRGGEAADMHREALRLATRISHPYEQGRALAGLAEHFARVDPVEARRHWERALAIFRRMGVPERFEAERRLAELG